MPDGSGNITIGNPKYQAPANTNPSIPSLYNTHHFKGSPHGLNSTRLEDIIEPEWFLRYTMQSSLETNVFLNSGITATSPQLTSAIMSGRGGHVVNIPHWKDLKSTHNPPVFKEGINQQYDENLSAYREFTPNKVGSGMITSTVLARGIAWGYNDLTIFYSGDNPLRAIAAGNGQYWSECYTDTILAATTGIFRLAGADLIYDASEKEFDVTDLIVASELLGDYQDKLTLVVCHSRIKSTLRLKQYVPTGFAQGPTGQIGISPSDVISYDVSRMANFTILADNRLRPELQLRESEKSGDPLTDLVKLENIKTRIANGTATSADKAAVKVVYPVFVFQQGSIAFDIGPLAGTAAIEFARNELNQGGENYIINRIGEICHPAGFSYTPEFLARDPNTGYLAFDDARAILAGMGSNGVRDLMGAGLGNADLVNPAVWTKAYRDRREQGLIKILAQASDRFIRADDPVYLQLV